MLSSCFYFFIGYIWLTESHVGQCMIKKDRSDENNAALTGFHENLITAYQDPALKPIHFSERSDGHNAPLLASSEA